MKFFVTDKVEIKNETNLPIFLLNKKYEKPSTKMNNQKLTDDALKKQIEETATKFQVHFNSLIWLSYRKGFDPLLKGEEEQLTQWI